MELIFSNQVNKLLWGIAFLSMLSPERRQELRGVGVPIPAAALSRRVCIHHRSVGHDHGRATGDLPTGGVTVAKPYQGPGCFHYNPGVNLLPPTFKKSCWLCSYWSCLFTLIPAFFIHFPKFSGFCSSKKV